MKRINITILLFIVLISCKKENDENDAPIISVEGIVVNSGTKLPIEGVLVFLTDGYPSGGFLDSGDKRKHTYNRDSVLTDSNGYYKLRMHAYEPVLSLHKLGYSFEYYMEGAVIGIVPLNPGYIYTNFDLEMIAHAGFQPYFMSIFPSALDTLYLQDLYYDRAGFKYKYWDISFTGIGPFQMYYYSQEAIGDKYRYYRIGYNRNNQWNERIDSVLIKSFTTYSDTIYY